MKISYEKYLKYIRYTFWIYNNLHMYKRIRNLYIVCELGNVNLYLFILDVQHTDISHGLNGNPYTYTAQGRFFTRIKFQ